MLKTRSKTLIFLIAIAVLLHFLLVPFGIHDDILSQAGWGQFLYENSPSLFYNNQVWIFAWPTQFPLANLSYSFAYFLYWKGLGIIDFLVNNITIPAFNTPLTELLHWYFLAKLPASPYQVIYIYIIKIFSSLADLGTAYLLYLIASKHNKKFSLLAPLLYLSAPFTIYISSYWGQSDPIGFFFLFWSFYLLYYRRFLFSPALLLISIQIKPTSLVFVPFYLYYFYTQKPSIKQFLASSVPALVLLLATFLPFTPPNKSFVDFFTSFPRIIFGKSEARLTTDSFNFWHIFTGNTAQNQNYPLFGIPSHYLAYSFFLGFYLFVIKKTRQLAKFDRLFIPLALIGLAAFLFLPTMLERYIFNGLVFLLVLVIKKPKLLPYWLALSLILFINLYHAQWFPPIPWLQYLLTLPSDPITRLLSVFNVAIFAILVRRLLSIR